MAAQPTTDQLLRKLSTIRSLEHRQASRDLTLREGRMLRHLRRELEGIHRPSLRRSSPRVVTALKVSFDDPSDFSDAFIRSVSGGGVMVGLDNGEQGSLRRGDLVSLRLSVSGEANLRLRGRVVWVAAASPSDGSGERVGVEFIDIDTKQRGAINKLLDSCRREPSNAASAR